MIDNKTKILAFFFFFDIEIFTPLFQSNLEPEREREGGREVRADPSTYCFGHLLRIENHLID